MKKILALGLLVGVIAAFKFLPWWVSVGAVLGLVVLGKFVFRKLFRGFFMGLFAAKGAVLKGARVRLHTISDAPPPKFDDDWDDDEEGMEQEPRCYRYVDMTITPVDADGVGRRVNDEEIEEQAASDDSDESDEACQGFSMWDPSELALVKPDARGGIDVEDDTIAEVLDVAVYENGQWSPLEGGKLMGAHRVRLHVGAIPGRDHFKVQYYFEVLKNAGSDA